MKKIKRISEEIKKKAIELGADLFGIADITKMEDLVRMKYYLESGFTRALSIGIKLSPAIFHEITDSPTPIYSHHYQIANSILDRIAFMMASLIDSYGYRALPIPASMLLDREKLLGHISHKAIANMAGIGWQGKNLLIINPNFGSRIRLVTILTNIDLEPTGPIKNRCGTCEECVKACPVKAIKGVSTELHYSSRNEAIDLSKCAKKLIEDFSNRPLINYPICGVCISVCPWSRTGERGYL